jgi:endoglucanase
VRDCRGDPLGRPYNWTRTTATNYDTGMWITLTITAALVLFTTAAGAVAAPVPAIPSDPSSQVASKIAYWNTQRRGTNCFNVVLTRDWWTAAKATGIEFVRLAPDKWSTKKRDFLIGDADHYDGLIEADFQQLKHALDQADSVGLRVVLTMLSLPGARWRQRNGDQPDLRLWRDAAYWTQTAQFWKDLAKRLKGHHAVVAYNLLNEPTPELTSPSVGDPSTWYSSVQGTSADLNGLYRAVIAAIRSVDDQTPIMLDAGSWASAASFVYLKPATDDKTLYAFHMYEPFEYTNRKANGGRYCFPGTVATESGDSINLDLRTLQTILAPVREWQDRNNVPSNRIIASEFGCNRTSCGVADYFADLIQIFNGQGWHWAFYAFREDGWDGMDYELGDKPPGAPYWDAVSRGKKPPSLPRVKNRIWDAIHSQLR